MIIKNFLFHRVSNETDALWPPMTPVLFDRVIKKLTNQFSIVPLEAFTEDPGSFKKLPNPLATILFDDGYKDNVEFAFPILKKHACPASFYVVTDCIDRGVPTWTYIIDYMLQNTQQAFIELDYAYVPEVYKKIILNNGINLGMKKFKPWMKSLPNRRRLQIMQAVINQCPDVIVPQNLMMNWDEVRQLHKEGFTIGSHTHTHAMLGQIEGSDEVEAELQNSFTKIKTHVGVSPETISYPIGSYNETVIALSKKVGYKLGLVVEQRFYNVNEDDRFCIPRLEIYQEPWLKVNARISGVYAAMKHLWK